MDEGADVRASDPQGSDIIAGSEKLDSQIIGTYLLNIDASSLSFFFFFKQLVFSFFF